MSRVKESDMGHYYAFTASAMSEHLEALSSGDFNKGLDIPMGVLDGAKLMLKEAAIQIRVDREKRDYPNGINPSRLMCLRRLVMEGAQKASGRKWDKELEDQVLEFARLTRDIPDDIRPDTQVYKPLQEFFGAIVEISDSYMFETPYKYLPG